VFDGTITIQAVAHAHAVGRLAVVGELALERFELAAHDVPAAAQYARERSFELGRLRRVDRAQVEKAQGRGRGLRRGRLSRLSHQRVRF
jgi:hypothetical protein